jgi:hypothetical protein
MSQSATITEMDILADAIAPNEGDLAPAAAESVLQWKFTDKAITRMNELARRNSEGTLTTAEQEELDKFMRVGGLINLVQAKARVSLKHHNSA